MSKARCIIALCFLIQSVGLWAQLDTIHWLPPMHARYEWGPQYLFLSTPEPIPFPVTIQDGAGNLVTTAMVSNAQPFEYFLGLDGTALSLVLIEELQTPKKGKGLVMHGPKPFYATYRAHSNNKQHAGDLTCKGRAALGKVFRIGHLLQSQTDGFNRSNFIGILATEDSTEVRLSDFDPNTKFQKGNTAVLMADPIKMVLNKGQSLVFSQYIRSDPHLQPPNGLMGALLTSSKPIVVNIGSWLGSPVNFPGHDIGIDQIVPFERVGKEYILCKGNGSEILEHPMVVAHVDGTRVFLNGSNSAVAVLNAGDFFSVPTEAFSSAGNMYIRTTEPVYLYQMIGGESVGDDQFRTAGLNFMPPLSCNISNSVDNIYLPNRIGEMSFAGGVMIVAMRDSAVTVRIHGNVASIGQPDPVPGNNDFVTYRNLSLFTRADSVHSISVVSGGSIQVAMFGHNEAASYAGFFSGFTKVNQPSVQLTLTGDGICPDTLTAHGRFDELSWFLGDSLIHQGADTVFSVYAPGPYVASGSLGACKNTDYAADTIDVKLQPLEFAYSVQEPTCFGLENGSISFSAPEGGVPPFVYSVDNGKHFSSQTAFEGLGEGTYKLVVKDSTGCYNQPLKIRVEQPGPLSVQMVLLEGGDSFDPGRQATISAIPDHTIVQSYWEPSDGSACPDCLLYSFIAEESRWVVVTVVDSAGCRATNQLLVEVIPEIYAPNAIAPSADAENGSFTLYSKQNLLIRRLQIYSRWGEMVFSKQQFRTNDPSAGWDGQFQGRSMQPGVFAWWAEIELVSGETKILYGDFTLVR